jgi:hypothetical protein
MSYSIHSLQAISEQRQAELIAAAEHARLRRLAKRAAAGRPAPSHRRRFAQLVRRPAVAR